MGHGRGDGEPRRGPTPRAAAAPHPQRLTRASSVPAGDASAPVTAGKPLDIVGQAAASLAPHPRPDGDGGFCRFSCAATFGYLVRIVKPYALSLVAASLLLSLAMPSCRHRDEPGPDQYAEYTCPDPIGKIIRDDCSKLALSYEGQNFSGSVGVKGVGAAAEYEKTAIREADSLIQMLKDQRVGLCNNFNTCKLTVSQYREEQARLDGSFVALLALKDHMANIGAEDAMRILEEIRAIRTTVVVPGGVTPQPTQPVPVAAELTPPQAAPAEAIPESLLDAWRPGKYMKQAVELVALGATRIAASTKYGFDADASCVLGAFLEKGEAITMTQHFVRGREYALLGGGSEGARDIDLHILRSTGEVVAADTDNDATPVVEFTSDSDDPMTLRLSLPDASSSGEFVAVAVMSSEGYNVPPNNLMKSFGSVLETAAKASELVKKRGANGLVFHAHGDWAFYGTVLEQNQQTAVSGLDLQAATNVVMAGHDGNAQDLDIAVEDVSEGDRQVVADTADDAQPLVTLQPTSGHVYRAKIANSKSAGPSLVTLLVLSTE